MLLLLFICRPFFTRLKNLTVLSIKVLGGKSNIKLSGRGFNVISKIFQNAQKKKQKITKQHS